MNLPTYINIIIVNNGDTMAFTYILPNDEFRDLRTTEQNSIIIIGANGSGKSRLGAWLEQGNGHTHHRLSGQRIVNFSSNIPLQSETVATNELWYGRNSANNKETARWNNGHFTTTVLSDFDTVLSLLFAKKASQDKEYVSLCKKAEQEGREKPNTSEDIIEKLIRIWNSVFPHRVIILDDNKINVVMPDGSSCYSGTEMSDGEKACLYLMAQCLAIPENKKIIIDEPELHLHPSIMNKLWSELEKARPDCLFFYITHDTNFAANHRKSTKFWVKSFDGKNWDIERIQDSELPQQLLLDILGNRKKVLFVEGTSNSWDIELYSEFYSGYYIIPCGGCATVIQNVKAMRNEPQLTHLECFGIIDRDFRTDAEIASLARKNIFALGVAEVENLFCTEGILRIVNQHLNKPDEEVITTAQTYIQNQFTAKKEEQIDKAVLAELKYQIQTSANKTQIEEKVAKYDTLRTNISEKFNMACNTDTILSIFNDKSLANDIGDKFGLTGEKYKEKVVALFRSDKHAEIKTALEPYMPAADKIPYEA